MWPGSTDDEADDEVPLTRRQPVAQAASSDTSGEESSSEEEGSSSDDEAAPAPSKHQRAQRPRPEPAQKSCSDTAESSEDAVPGAVDADDGVEQPAARRQASPAAAADGAGPAVAEEADQVHLGFQAKPHAVSSSFYCMLGPDATTANWCACLFVRLLEADSWCNVCMYILTVYIHTGVLLRAQLVRQQAPGRLQPEPGFWRLRRATPRESRPVEGRMRSWKTMWREWCRACTPPPRRPPPAAARGRPPPRPPRSTRQTPQ